MDGSVYTTHRLSAHLWNGFSLDSDLRILHSCDVRACFNPAHLSPGTAKDNSLDAARKGRMAHKLTVEQVTAIKWKLTQGAAIRPLAREFNVSQRTIQSIARGKTWEHVSPAPPSA